MRNTKIFYNMQGDDLSGAEERQWQDFKRGSQKAFQQIYEQYFPKLYNYGRKFSKDTALVEDCIQQLFVDLWRTKANLADTPSVKNYLYKSFRRALLHKINYKSPSVFADEVPFEAILSPEAGIIREEEQAERQEWLRKAFQHLSEHQREAIFLKFYEQLSYVEVGQVMNLEVRAVYDLVYKGIARLKKQVHRLPMVPTPMDSLIAPWLAS